MSTAENVLETSSEAPPVEQVTPPDQATIDAIIRNRVYASLAVGLVPVPLVDLAALTAVQVELLYRLSQAYNVPFKEEWGRKAVSVTLSTVVPELIAPTLSNFVRYVPLIGQALSTASGPVIYGASTYALGRAFAKHFASGGDFLSVDFSKVGNEVKSGYEKSKDTVKKLLKKGGKGQEGEPGTDAVPAAG
ncbi:hypothetical protein FACS1894116_06740 [Betaproteobacteria bacterium]|nr:hypothetical protein FACS1894116_06740 [Betaproteobacteria bacterium]GHU10811.1 hypothetical protein AGMMS50225_15000 [Betaproteobacteria bacterium]GHU23862.1 hypothetical protein FACS189488_07310 [Betaproteobacteria bacterium]